MSQDIVPAASDPARAFEDLRGEVSLLRRAVQGLTAERENAPDYLPTLQQMVERLDWLTREVERISKAPAMELNAETLTRRLEQASDHARTEASRLVADANVAARASIARIDAVVDRGWTAERQWRQLFWAAGIAFVLGVILCFALPRFLASHTPGAAKEAGSQPPPRHAIKVACLDPLLRVLRADLPRILKRRFSRVIVFDLLRLTADDVPCNLLGGDVAHADNSLDVE